MTSYVCERHHGWHMQTAWTNMKHMAHDLGTNVRGHGGGISIGCLRVIQNLYRCFHGISWWVTLVGVGS